MHEVSLSLANRFHAQITRRKTSGMESGTVITDVIAFGEWTVRRDIHSTFSGDSIFTLGRHHCIHSARAFAGRLGSSRKRVRE